MPFLVVAVTGRALAASAARAGHRVVLLDCFADRDARAAAIECRCVVAGRGLSLDGRALVSAAKALAPPERCAGLVYGSGFEGRTDLLARLAAGRRVFGNAPSVVAAVKDPRRFFPLLDRLGIRYPDVRRAAPRDPAGWLVKRPGGAGGAHVRHARPGRVRAGSYFQRFEDGRCLSALFLADGGRARVIGFNEQWSVAARRDRPFLYGGAVGGVVLPAAVRSDLCAKLDRLVAAVGLVGLNGLDFLLRDHEWLALEVNPRPTATAELYDADYPRGLFDCHVRACAGELPARPARPRAVRAHAVLYAPTRGRVASTWDFPAWCRDVPNPGTRFAAGDPICTVHAAASNATRARALLRRRHASMQRAVVEVAA